MISREAYQVKDRPRNFYLMSAMGSELALGIGLAYTRKDLKVIVISGDGSALMGFSSVFLSSYLKLDNLKCYVLNNQCYATTGGQPTCFSMPFDITGVIEVSNEKGDAPRIPLTPKQITERFKNAISLHSTQSIN